MKLLKKAIIMVVLLVSCTTQPPVKISTPVGDLTMPSSVSTPIGKIYNPIVNNTPYNFYGDYPNFDFLYTYNFDRQRAIKIMSEINYSYVKGSQINILHSKRLDYGKGGVEYVGMYYNYGIIYIYEYGEDDLTIRNYILHELKHFYCDKTTGNLEMNHQGCYLNTPIDKEYRFIK